MTPPDNKALAERLEHEAMTLDAECRITAKHSTSTNTPTRRAALYREAAEALTRESLTGRAAEALDAAVRDALKRGAGTIRVEHVPHDEPSTPSAQLWCLHIQGPDDIHPAPSKAHAEKAAEWFNKRYAGEQDVMMRAVVEPYPYSAESHAEGVDSFITDWLLPQCVTTPSAQAGEVVGWEWRYIGGDPYPNGTTVARSLHEMDPNSPPYPDTWQPARPLYATPQPQGDAIDRERSTPRREAAVRLVLAEGWNWDGTAWTREPQGDASPEVSGGGECNCASGRGSEHCVVHAPRETLAALSTPSAQVSGGGEEVAAVAAEMLGVAPTCESDWDEQLREWAHRLSSAALSAPQARPDGGEFRELAERAIPFLRDEGAKYDDDGSNEPLELARDIENALASNPPAESALSSASLALDGGAEAALSTPQARPGQHPESTCQDCGGRNTVWSAPNDIWNRVVGSPNGILCPVCFVERAKAAGINEVWHLAPSRPPTGARPDGGAVAVVCLTPDAYANGQMAELQVQWTGKRRLQRGDSLYTHPTPAPDAVARLVEALRRAGKALCADTSESSLGQQIREALAPFTAAQPESTNGQE